MFAGCKPRFPEGRNQYNESRGQYQYGQKPGRKPQHFAKTGKKTHKKSLW